MIPQYTTVWTHEAENFNARSTSLHPCSLIDRNSFCCKHMKLDLRKDQKAIAKPIAERVRDYPVYVNNGPGEDDDPISLITLGFAFDQSGWIALVFDTRPKAESDGHWQSYLEENEQSLEHWFDAVDPIHEATAFGGKADSLVITRHDGKKKIFKQYDVEEIAEQVGSMLWQTLVDARDKGLFKKLPLVKGCLMGVEEQDGYYEWPHYKDRIKLGRVD